MVSEVPILILFVEIFSLLDFAVFRDFCGLALLMIERTDKSMNLEGLSDTEVCAPCIYSPTEHTESAHASRALNSES